MKVLRITSVLILLFILSACSVPQKSNKPKTIKSGSLETLRLLPKNIEGFSYLGTRAYPKPWGHSSRYVYDKDKKTYADVFVYPVPKEAVGYSHKNRVSGMTNHALNEITIIKKQGLYSKYQILKRKSFQLKGKTTSRVDTLIVKNKIALYSLLFLTESNGQLLKIRMSMPDSKQNRTNPLWQKFAEKAFSDL